MGFFIWLPDPDCCKNFTYDFELERVKTISKRTLQHQKHLDSYVNPIKRAQEYLRIMQEERITQSQLAEKLGVSRVRVNQYLALLKLPEERQTTILKHGKEEMITERTLRKVIADKNS